MARDSVSANGSGFRLIEKITVNGILYHWFQFLPTIALRKNRFPQTLRAIAAV